MKLTTRILLTATITVVVGAYVRVVKGKQRNARHTAENETVQRAYKARLKALASVLEKTQDPEAVREILLATIPINWFNEEEEEEDNPFKDIFTFLLAGGPFDYDQLMADIRHIGADEDGEEEDDTVVEEDGGSGGQEK